MKISTPPKWNIIILSFLSGWMACGSLLIFLFGKDISQREQDLINRGFAYYHPQTAKFTWKTNMVEKVEKVEKVEFNK